MILIKQLYTTLSVVIFMLEYILNIDQEIFLSINQGWSNSFFDWLLPILRNPFSWAPLYLFLIIFFIRTYGKTGIYIVAMSLVTVGITDSVSSHIIKKKIERVRPCNDPVFKEDVTLRVRCGSGFSFTSSHAANHFGLALFWIFLFGRKWRATSLLAISWALLIGISQVYVGVHYPLDILVGGLFGILVGLGTGFLFKSFVPAFFINKADISTSDE
ncbi:MAG TPA: phosphatase PAP2 family protein [Sphingobacterium sp.]|nr:phosphatase PAP2 family protein [Sphingobacterium sp.]